jgi:hypothetical protein
MKFIARGLLFSKQCALGHVADVKDAVGFADMDVAGAVASPRKTPLGFNSC